MAGRKGEVIGYCGKPGRLARAVIRGAETSALSSYTTADAVKHIRGCPTCRQRIAQAIEGNPGTTYGESVETTLWVAGSRPSQSITRRRWWE